VRKGGEVGMSKTEGVINDLNVVKITLCNPQMLLTQEMRVRIGRVITSATDLLKEQKTENTGSCRVFQCKKCGFGINDIFVNDEEKYQIVPRYCPNCGRLVM